MRLYPSFYHPVPLGSEACQHGGMGGKREAEGDGLGVEGVRPSLPQVRDIRSGGRTEPVWACAVDAYHHNPTDHGLC